MSAENRAGSIFIFVGLIIAGFIIYNYISSSEEKGDNLPAVNRYNSRSSSSSSTYSYKQTLYAHKTVNVRDSTGTQYEIINNLNRGDVVKVEKTYGDWVQVSRSGRIIGFAYKPVLETTPIPDYEIVSWNWRKDPGFGTNGAVIWNVQVRNNTDRYIEHLKVEFTSFDSQGRIVTSDYSFVDGLSPGGTGSDKSYATYFGTEKKASIRIVP